MPVNNFFYNFIEMESSLSHKIRITIFEWLSIQVNLHGDVLNWQLLSSGFRHEGERVPLIGRQGIWKPAVFDKYPISIRTVPESPYADRITKENTLLYHYRGTNPNHWDNVCLRETMKNRVPLIYLHRIIKGKYYVHWPVYVIGEDRINNMFIIQADTVSIPKVENVSDSAVDEGRRRYITTEVMQRLHQRSFREKVLAAYREHCAICSLRHRELLDAAHIIPDNEGGEPVVQNGLSMCKLHHAAFDQNIIGVNPDYFIEVSDDILKEEDGPMLKYGLQKLHFQKIILPSKSKWPNKEWLEIRYEKFRKAV
jgi:putative restriction endonuclease